MSSPPPPSPPPSPPASSPPPRTTQIHLPTHTLVLTTHGPAPSPSNRNASIVLIQGLASDSHMWSKVLSLLSDPQCNTTSSTARPTTVHPATNPTTYSYTRAGYPPSTRSPHPPTSTAIAQDLSLLLSTASITPPYILLAHSWGGILLREFLAIRGKEQIAGVVLVDANQEHTLKRLDWRNRALWAVAGGECRGSRGVCERVMGMPGRQRLDGGEYEAHLREVESEAHKAQAAAEYAQYATSFTTLLQKPHLLLNPSDPPLGDTPLVVIKGDNRRDYAALYEHGVEHGYGTDVEREEFLRVLEMWDEVDGGLQREVAEGLARGGRYAEVEEAGHDVQMTAPEVVVREVMWVVGEVERRRRKGNEGQEALKGRGGGKETWDVAS